MFLLEAIYQSKDRKTGYGFNPPNQIVEKMNINQYKKEVEKLQKLETKLTLHIASTDDQELMNLFLEWQDQRIVYNECLEKLLDSTNNYTEA